MARRDRPRTETGLDLDAGRRYCSPRLMSAKALLRDSVRQQVRALSPTERNSCSERLCERLRGLTVWQRATTVLLFAPLVDEPDITPLLEEALSSGRKVAMPRFDAGAQIYQAASLAGRHELEPGRFGALEPIAGCPSISLKQLDFILVPGIAFDLVGRRLGRGKGFYDRLLAEVLGHKCGVAFDVQIVAELPEEPHDVRVDSILTPTRWHSCQRAA
jgi:5-formyltetrahydrofolate cyclo-ligase